MTLKTDPDKPTSRTLRDQPNREGAAWTPALSRGFGLSASDSESRVCVALGRRLSITHTHEHNEGGDDGD